MALHDLKAKLLDVSLLGMLGASRDRIMIYGSGGFTSYDHAQLRGQLGGWAEQGIRAVKMKIGTDAAADPARVRAARAAIGDEVEFGGWGGIYAPKGLPDDVKEKLESAVKEAVDSDAYQKFQKDAGNLVVYRDSAEWTDFVDEQFTLFQDLLG